MLRRAAIAVSRGLRAEALKSSYPGIRAFADDASLLKTPLFDYHIANGGELGLLAPSATARLVDRFATGATTTTLRLFLSMHLLMHSKPLHLNLNMQGKWFPLPAGQCPFSTRTASWKALSGAAPTRRSLTSLTCVALRSRWVQKKVWGLSMILRQYAAAGGWLQGGGPMVRQPPSACEWLPAPGAGGQPRCSQHSAGAKA